MLFIAQFLYCAVVVAEQCLRARHASNADAQSRR
jgi:hypothetical protein